MFCVTNAASRPTGPWRERLKRPMIYPTAVNSRWRAARSRNLHSRRPRAIRRCRLSRLVCSPIQVSDIPIIKSQLPARLLPHQIDVLYTLSANPAEGELGRRARRRVLSPTDPAGGELSLRFSPSLSRSAMLKGSLGNPCRARQEISHQARRPARPPTLGPNSRGNISASFRSGPLSEGIDRRRHFLGYDA
jgi:hypothetical protein